MKTLHKEFISSYQGRCDYWIGGQRYECRSSAHDDGQYMPGIYDNEILPCVGTVKVSCGTDYPPDEVMDLFPGYVPVVYDHSTKRMKYLKKPSVTVVRDSVMATAWVKDLEKLGLSV